MGIYFMMGAVSTSFLLIQIDFSIIFSFLILANIVPGYAPLFRVIAVIVAFLLIAGHIRATSAVAPEVNRQSDNAIDKAQENEQKIYKVEEDQKTAWDIFYSTLFTNFYLIGQGIVWRLKKEVKYIRRVAAFNFQADE